MNTFIFRNGKLYYKNLCNKYQILASAQSWEKISIQGSQICWQR